MDNERMDIPQEDWLDDVLGAAAPESSLGPDESAVASAGLIHPDDMELEMIIAEHRPEDISDVIEAAVAQQIELADAATSQEPAQEPGDVMTEETQFFTPLTQESAEEYSAEPADEVCEEAIDPVVDPQEPEQEIFEEAPEEPLPLRKGRPKRKSGYGLWGIPHLLSTVIWLVLILAIGISLGRTLWLCCADLMAFGKKPATATITITEDDDMDSIAQELADKGLIRYPGLFKKFAQLTNKDENISQGTFTLSSHLDYNAMINGMSAYANARKEVDIMFPEGYTCAQIFALLEENEVCTVEELEEYAANGELEDFWFLEGVERGDKYCLEGYLFPDTYTFYTYDNPGRVLEKFLYAFDSRFTDIMKERLTEISDTHASRLASEGYGQDYIDEHRLTVREIVIIASLIEKESSGGDESYTIASVIYNRLTDSTYPPYLNIDAALIYALDGNVDPQTGEVKPLTNADKKLDSPYNTYLYTGLTPGPISNPGQESLNAALTPDETDYYYYALDPETGKHKFFKSLSAFEDFLDTVEY